VWSAAREPCRVRRRCAACAVRRAGKDETDQWDKIFNIMGYSDERWPAAKELKK
jgi:hypothetical protein